MEQSWWYRGRARAIDAALRKTGVMSVATALDYGAGFGGMFVHLNRFADRIEAFEPDTEARTTLLSRGYAMVHETEADAFRNAYDIVGLFDVLEHIEHDEAFLTNAHAGITKGGVLTLTVPAFPFLWSIHDEQKHHFRRYTRRSVTEVLQKTGYRVEYCSYWNTSLFLPAAAMRLAGRTGDEALALPVWINALLYSVVYIESLVLRFVPLPFGTGLVVVARKAVE